MQIIHKADGFEAQRLLVIPAIFLDQVSRHPLVNSMLLTDIGFFPHALYHYRERANGCDAYIFIYCIDGEGWLIVGNEKKTLIHKDTLVVIPASTPHVYGASETDPWSIYWFHLKGAEVEQLVQHFAISNHTLHVPALQATRIAHLFNECYETLLYKGYSVKHYLYVSLSMRHLLGMFLLLQGEAQQDNKQNKTIDSAIQYMLEHIQSSVTLSELADHVGLSKPHFIHLFKQVTGYSPIDYCLHLKIQRSCLYLELTTTSIKEVAQRVGFQDPYYFSRLFHKIMGQSPAAYRRAKQNS
jgi:AraC-like DNA-binding protein